MIVSDPRLTETMVYYLCAKEFGWTPQQTDGVENETLQSLMVVLEAVKRREAQEAKSNHG